MRDLPKDLVEEILCHIPAKSLKRLLRSTYKPWNRLLNDSRFAREHSEKAPKEFLLLLLTCEFRICPLTLNFHGGPSLEVKSEVSLIDPNYRYNQFDVGQVFHCDGLLFCVSVKESRLVVWNPCTDQTKWINTCPSKYGHGHRNFVLGYYYHQDKKSKSYKILTYYPVTKASEIYELSSDDSWRILDYDVSPGWSLHYSLNRVSLKGTTFVFDMDDTLGKDLLGLSLLSFDFLTEKFIHVVSLPCNWTYYEAVSLSVVKQDKISVLLQGKSNSTTEIWLTNKIDFVDNTKAAPVVSLVSGSKVLALDLSGVETVCRDMVYIIGLL